MSSGFLSPTPLIGRGADSDALESLLLEHRLITLWGPAGMGKSRLAMHLVEARLRAGELAVFGELANVRDRDGLVSVLTHALSGARAARGRGADALRAALKSRAPTLLVLDNVEQIADAAAALLIELLREPSHVRFVVTSRERLRVAAEHCYELAPLALPAPGEDPLAAAAVQLFLERAKSGAGRGLAAAWPTEPERADLARLVTELEGVPLAIELAAARLGVLGLDGLITRLPRRLDLLTRGRRDMPSRQSSLRGAVAWSWDLLPAAEKTVLARASVFRGSFDLEAARAVVQLPDDQVMESLSELHDKSLVRAHAEPGRFAFYESIRAFAEESLEPDAQAEVALRHRAHFLERADSARRSDADRDNFECAAHAALAAGDVRAARVLTLAVDAIIVRRGPFGLHRRLLDSALEAAVDETHDPASDGDRELVAALHLARGNSHAMAGRAREAERDLDEALALASDAATAPASRLAPGLLSKVHLERALFLHRERRLAEAERSYEQAAELLRAAGDAIGLGRALGNLGAVAHDRGDLADAARRYEEAIAVLRRAGDRRIAATLESNFGLLEQERGELDKAALRFERAVLELEAEGDRRLLAIAVGNQSALYAELERPEPARVAGERALSLLAGLGDTRSTAIARARLAGALAELDRHDEAAAMVGAARRELCDGDDVLAQAVVDIHEAFLDLALGRRALAEAQAGRGKAHLARVRDRIAAAQAGGEESAAAKSDDVRVAVRRLERGLVRAFVREGDAPSALIVEREARWFRVGAGEVEWLDRRRAPRLILLALARLREQTPGTGRPLDALFDAGWPGEKALPDAVENRVNVALAYLRRGALRPLLLKGDAGYLLDPAVPLLWSDRDP